MTTVSDEYLEKIFKDVKTEVEKAHLILPSMKIERICQLKKFNKFLLLDLRNNSISSTVNFTNLCCLRFLFLQNNDIKKIQGFKNLTCLETLFLDFNKIDVIENLEMCPLRKLSVKGQRLQPEKHLLLDLRTMAGLSHQLSVLNVSKNGLVNLGPLRYLRALEELDASGNKLTTASAVESGLVGSQGCIRSLDVLGNPLMKGRGATIRLIACLPRLQRLNGIEVKEDMRFACRHIHAVGGAGEEGEMKQALQARVSDIPEAFRPKIDNHLIKEAKAKETGRVSKIRNWKIDDK